MEVFDIVLTEVQNQHDRLCKEIFSERKVVTVFLKYYLLEDILVIIGNVCGVLCIIVRD